MYLKISDFARRVGVSTVTLRQWDAWGWFSPEVRKENGYRYYTEGQIEDFFVEQRKRKDIRYRRGEYKNVPRSERI